MSMFLRTGPFYDSPGGRKTLQYRPLQVGDVVTDGFTHYRIEEFVRFCGKLLVMVQCVDSLDIDQRGRIGYKSMHFVTTQCWRPFTS